MARKIGQLIADLIRAGFTNRGGRGSHRNFEMKGVRITLSGKESDDAKPYQEKSVRLAIQKAGKP